MNHQLTITAHSASGNLIRREQMSDRREATVRLSAIIGLLSGRQADPTEFRDPAQAKVAEALDELAAGAPIGRALHVDGNGSVALECRRVSGSPGGRATPPECGAAEPRVRAASSPPTGAGVSKEVQ